MPMSEEDRLRSYAETKEFTCVCCGEPVVLTKFASAKTAKCPKCKASNRAVDPDILAGITHKASDSHKSSPPKQVDSDGDPIPSDMKLSHCIKCGAEVIVTKFASHAKTLCERCKGIDKPKDWGDAPEIDIDRSKITKGMIEPPSEAFVSASIIANERLRNVECPGCGFKMKIIKILDSSPERGLVVMYQCTNTGCLMLMTVSEQCKFPMKPVQQHVMFSYRGEELIELTHTMQESRARNAIEYLLHILDDHGISVDGVDLPDGITADRVVKSVPIGLSRETPTSDTTGDGNNGDQ